MSSITVYSPAKINLFLHIHQQRDDGYHDLKTYFQLVDLCDQLIFSPSDDITVNNPLLPIPESADLCYKAAKLIQSYSKTSQGIHINVNKYIPDGGGLGGGSSNAATVLVVLNQLWGLHLSEEELLSLALQLGSDVPVFVYGRSTYAEGRGEIFSEHMGSDMLKNQSIIIIKPNIYASTTKIFQHPRLTKRPDAGKIRHLKAVCGQNDFEKVVFDLYPELSNVSKRLSVYSSACLTGTGACLYAVLDDETKADRIRRDFGEELQVFVVNTLEQSPVKTFR